MNNISTIETLICDRNFSYLEPYFYNYPYSLRCELGIGEKNEFYKNAKKRALEIYNILFLQEIGADAIIFNYYINDYSDSGDAFCKTLQNNNYSKMTSLTIDEEINTLIFLSECQYRYRHAAIKNLETYDSADENEKYPKIQRHRIVCYRDNSSDGFEHEKLIEMQLQELNESSLGIGLVSFKNECIFSVYDSRGCDIVFAEKEKMQFFYTKLEKYLLAYDLDEMKRRCGG